MKNTPHYVWIEGKLYTHTPSVPTEDIDCVQYAPVAAFINQECCQTACGEETPTGCAANCSSGEDEDESIDAFVDYIISDLTKKDQSKKGNTIDLSKLFKILGVE